MRRMLIVLCCLLATVFLLSGITSAATTHEKRISKFDGSGSCTVCHKNAAKEVVESLHYQQMAEPLSIEGWEKGKQAGMMVTY